MYYSIFLYSILLYKNIKWLEMLILKKIIQS